MLKIPVTYGILWFLFYLGLAALLGPFGFTGEVGLCALMLLAIAPTVVVYRSREGNKEAKDKDGQE